MAVLEIKRLGEEILREKAAPVRKINKNTRAILEDMADTLYAANGVGLAAPQIGISKRIVVIDVGEGLLELINPRITRTEGEATGWEGCLSIPEYVGYVTRAGKVTVEALDRDGRTIWIDGEGLLAVALQHEIDHLDGVMFVDKAAKVMSSETEESSAVEESGEEE